ncbi:MAG: Rrf2 family transcriptional regulator [Phycisphaerales bacterium]|nr:Rrf2 family transcriptional regulator [Phycisphaerales bacterium]
MFSSTAEYALRAAVDLATHAGQARTSQQVARDSQIPSGYVSKVLQDLGKAGLVNSQRGPNGGFTLARPAESITILEAINAVDPIKRITRCPLNLPAHSKKLCKLHQHLDDAIAEVERALSSTSLADLVSDGPAGFPPVPTKTPLTAKGKKVK